MIDFELLAYLGIAPIGALALGIWALWIGRERPEKAAPPAE